MHERKYYQQELNISIDTVLTQDNFTTVKDFSSGDFAFDQFLKEESLDCCSKGEGVTYLIKTNDTLLGYVTFEASAIPYVDRIKLDEKEQKIQGCEYDEKECSIPALEVKMFAIDSRYQDLFYKYNQFDMPIASWALYYVILKAEDMITNMLGFKSIFLFSVPKAQSFYEQIGFKELDKGKFSFWNSDDELIPMYLTLRDIDYSYDE